MATVGVWPMVSDYRHQSDLRSPGGQTKWRQSRLSRGWDDSHVVKTPVTSLS